MRADLSSFLERATVVELLLAFVFATTSVAFVSAVVSGLVMTPIRTSTDRFGGSFGDLSVSAFGRAFDFTNIVQTGIVLLIALVGGAMLLRRADDALWDSSPFRACPHCLSDVPAGASVCSYCTRDLPPASEVLDPPSE